MVSYQELQKIAKTRLKDAEILYNKNRYNGAIHVCALASELAFKAIICRKLKLKGIPNRIHEFKIIQDIKTHNLEELIKILLRLDKEIPDEIINNQNSDWNIILDWDPDRKYLPIDEKSLGQWKREASELIKSTKKILTLLWENL